MGFTTSEGHKEICSPAAFVVSLQILEGFKVWRSPITLCATEQKLPFCVCVIVDIYLFSALFFNTSLLLHLFSFQNFSLQADLTYNSFNTVKVALLEHNMFVLFLWPIWICISVATDFY